MGLCVARPGLCRVLGAVSTQAHKSVLNDASILGVVSSETAALSHTFGLRVHLIVGLCSAFVAAGKKSEQIARKFALVVFYCGIEALPCYFFSKSWSCAPDIEDRVTGFWLGFWAQPKIGGPIQGFFALFPPIERTDVIAAQFIVAAALVVGVREILQ